MLQWSLSHVRGQGRITYAVSGKHFVSIYLIVQLV